MQPSPRYIFDKLSRQRMNDVEQVCREIIDHKMLLNDPVCVVATVREDFRRRLEQETKQGRAV